jgi:hypothetical protein
MLGKIISTKSGYKLIELTPEEEKEVLEELRKKNKEIMRVCLGDAEEMLSPPKVPALLPAQITTKIATALFEKLSTQSFTEISSALDKKVFEIKEKQNEKTSEY